MATRSMITVNDASISTAMISAMCDQVEISTSTGFIWSNESGSYIVTNWHCVTGVNPFSGKFLSHRYAARPTEIRVALATEEAERRREYTVPLFDVDGNPTWLVHPVAGEQVDIAAVALPMHSSHATDTPRQVGRAMNEYTWPRFQPFVGGELFVVGYPRNLNMYGLPIWKRATFATEPNLFADQAGRRQVWIDCTSREGMSGSPVIQVRRAHGMRLRGTVEDKKYDDLLDGYSFYGIYSGRLVDPEDDPRMDDQLAAQIGIVWPRQLIETVVSHGRRDTFRREDAFLPTIS